MSETEQAATEQGIAQRTAWVDQFPDDENWDCWRKQDCNEDTSTIRILAHRRGTTSWGLLAFEASDDSVHRTDWVPVADPAALFAEDGDRPEDNFEPTMRQPEPPAWREWRGRGEDGKLSEATSTSVLHHLALADWQDLNCRGVGEPYPPGEILGVGDGGNDYFLLIRRHRGKYFEDLVHVGYQQTHQVDPMSEDQAKEELARFARE